MSENNDKITQFMQAVTDHAAAQSKQVHQEVVAYKRKRLSEAEKKALAESTELIKKEHVALQKQIRLEMSRRELTARQQLLQERQRMTETIFREAREKLIAFTDEPDYLPFLTASIRAIAAQIPAENTVYFAAQRDTRLKADLEKLLPEGAELRFVKDITVGGIRTYHAPSGKMLDDTLDTRLAEQREWFITASGLTVE